MEREEGVTVRRRSFFVSHTIIVLGHWTSFCFHFFNKNKTRTPTPSPLPPTSSQKPQPFKTPITLKPLTTFGKEMCYDDGIIFFFLNRGGSGKIRNDETYTSLYPFDSTPPPPSLPLSKKKKRVRVIPTCDDGWSEISDVLSSFPSSLYLYTSLRRSRRVLNIYPFPITSPPPPLLTLLSHVGKKREGSFCTPEEKNQVRLSWPTKRDIIKIRVKLHQTL